MKEIRDFSVLQKEILTAVQHIIKSPGRLVYSTCTVEKLENDQVVGDFLQSQRRLKIAPLPESFTQYTANGPFLHTFPHLHFCDGSFAVLLKNR